MNASTLLDPSPVSAIRVMRLEQIREHATVSIKNLRNSCKTRIILMVQANQSRQFLKYAGQHSADSKECYLQFTF